MPDITYTDSEAAEALVKTIGNSKWDAVAFAFAFLGVQSGQSELEAARVIYERDATSLKISKELVKQFRTGGFVKLLSERKKLGSAENPATKLFPATITEERFVELLDQLCDERPGLTYSDDRGARHSLKDFTIHENGYDLPINIKNAGTRFEQALRLVGVEPDDCIPIPAYKAYGALEVLPDLLYVISVDYDLITKLNKFLPATLTRDEMIVWDLLNVYSGKNIKDAEDTFIFTTVKKHWEKMKGIALSNPFHVISARKSVRILQTKPQRTPGIGLKAWGTGANAEVNVHVCISDDTTPWTSVRERMVSKGVIDIINAVNRKRTEVVYDPEI